MIMSSSVRPRLLAGAVASLVLLVATPTATAESDKFRFFEETAGAFWGVPHECADGAMVTATLLVQTTRDFEYPDRDDPDPTARVQYQAVCPDGTSFSWIGFVPAEISSTDNLKGVTARGSGTVTDIFDMPHQVTFDVVWTGVGALQSTVNGPGSTRKQREAIATGVVTFHGEVLVEGQALHPTRPEPFIRVDIEK